MMPKLERRLRSPLVVTKQAVGTDPIVADSDAGGLLDGAELRTASFATQPAIWTTADPA